MRAILTCFALGFATSAIAGDVEDGAAHFADYCATCHGVAAMGDGPMAAMLTKKPANLTRLSQDNNGAFPMARVVRRIDGTTDVQAHGGAMPLFGLLLQGPSEAILAPDGSEIMAPEAIAQIATWLETVQE